jgi:hypothetical protein
VNSRCLLRKRKLQLISFHDDVIIICLNKLLEHFEEINDSHRETYVSSRTIAAVKMQDHLSCMARNFDVLDICEALQSLCFYLFLKRDRESLKKK